MPGRWGDFGSFRLQRRLKNGTRTAQSRLGADPTTHLFRISQISQWCIRLLACSYAQNRVMGNFHCTREWLQPALSLNKGKGTATSRGSLII